jgi:hypothetical protein
MAFHAMHGMDSGSGSDSDVAAAAASFELTFRKSGCLQAPKYYSAAVLSNTETAAQLQKVLSYCMANEQEALAYVQARVQWHVALAPRMCYIITDSVLPRDIDPDTQRDRNLR